MATVSTMDEPAPAREPGLRGRPVALLAAGSGLLLGTTDFLVQQTPLGQLTNSVAVWTALAFAVGACVSPPTSRAVLAAGAALVVAIGTWYAVAQSVYGLYDLSALPHILIWSGAAVAAGLVFGIAGTWWRFHRGSWRAGLGLAALVALFAVEGGYSFLVLHQPGWGAEKLAVAAVLLVALSRPLRRRREPLLLAVPVVALGAAGYLALDAVLALAGAR
jgi:predicted secreted protein